MHLIMGVHAIRELLTHAPERLLRLFTSRKSHPDILKACEKQNIPISFVSEQELSKMVDSDSHQSLVAQVKPRHFLDVKEFLQHIADKETAFILMLDQIFDPQNFGAILRSAECFGVDGVIWSKNRGADLTPVVAKASSGASELLPLIRVSNLADSIDKFQKEGFEVVTALLDPTSQSAFQFTFAPKTVLIVGSEGEGIQPLLQKKADRSIYIPMQGKIQSLNVAQATAVLLSLKIKAENG
ncbi:MAG TPA: 23S rRNA (guanosine(2251)-2'-O)-methyltransferase RlmB [Chlamydiales bacterium]|nr:23S rRNA (guanosine(2251)-2'-O)-methyltransferase RlmB [Chlamydiales bacterium]